MKQLFYQPDGPLTRELLRTPGDFGLGQVPASRNPDATVDMVCGYCSTGCGLKIHLNNNEAINLSPSNGYPVNLGMACPKGWEALNVLDSSERAVTPLVRNSQGNLEPVDWNAALQTFTDRLKAIQREHGSESVAFLSTGQIPTEEMAFLGALAKFGMGMLHGDGNTRQCMATSVVAYKEAFGFDAPPYTYADFEESDVIVLVGSNLCIAHPIMWERIMRNPRSPEIIVIDPRMTETAMNASLHLPLNPKSDMALLYGIARILAADGHIDQQFIERSTDGFDEFMEFVQPFTLERVAQDTGLPAESVERMAQLIGAGKRVSFWWTMGVNQSHQGVRTAQAIINLALMTGNIGRPGTGANSITGQCNAMGSRLFSNTTNLLGGHDFANPQHRQKVADILGIDVAQIPDRLGLPYHRIMEEIEAGNIRGLWVVCTNPAHSWIQQSRCHEILNKLDFLVVQDMYHTTETARHADLVLPAAGWGEKDGTFINSERRLGVLRKVRRAPGQALADFQIFRLIADAWGCGEMFREWTTPAKVFEFLRQCSAGQPCDFSGIKDFQMINECGGIQWPLRAADEFEPERRLFADGRFFHEHGRARFVFEEQRPLPESASPEYPLVLLTGRGSASQWHTQTRTRQSSVLRKLYPSGVFLELNPEDAEALQIISGDTVVVSSVRGQLSALALVTRAVRTGTVFIPMHYPEVNQLTRADFDPYSGQPAYKGCAVRVSRQNVPA